MTMRSMHDCWMRSLGALVFMAIQLSTSAGSAHDWYPVECCRGDDCAEVEHATYDRPSHAGDTLPLLAVTTRHGTALVPANFPRRESLDGKIHACMRPGQGDMRLICLFVPPPS
jgi:hypothetical protein